MPEKHGMLYAPEYGPWREMKKRCTNPKAKHYDKYGGRGIKVCDEWMHSFAAFFAYMGPRPSPDHSVDRIDNDGNYEPGNCRWATRFEQQANTRMTRLVTIDGKTLSFCGWAREKGLSYGLIRQRESKGWTLYDAIMTPPLRSRKGKPNKNQIAAMARAAATADAGKVKPNNGGEA